MALFTEGVASNHRGELLQSFRELMSSSSEQKPALNVAAAGPLLHVQLPLFVPPSRKIRADFSDAPNDVDETAFFKLLQDHETGLRTNATYGATVLCGSQRTARKARAEINAASGSSKPPQV